jgi:hypothetical protein
MRSAKQGFLRSQNGVVEFAADSSQQKEQKLKNIKKYISPHANFLRKDEKTKKPKSLQLQQIICNVKQQTEKK